MCWFYNAQWCVAIYVFNILQEQVGNQDYQCVSFMMSSGMLTVCAQKFYNKIRKLDTWTYQFVDGTVIIGAEQHV